ncbi:hypothetical protein [Octadecabacter ascidiaceicola]|nr:hypothetical protein [Octadecabacter ascidiaceicola]
MTTDDKMLEAAFAQARTPDVMPSEDALNRIMMDADSVLAAPTPVKRRPKQGIGVMILEAIGGWTAFGGLATATVAGLWIGISPPAALTDLSAGLWGATIEVPLLESDMFAGLEG